MTAARFGTIEVRTYRAQPGQRSEAMAILRTEVFPVQRALGMALLGPFIGEDDDSFVWLRGFRNERGHAALAESFYATRAWKTRIRPRLMPLLHSHTVTTYTVAAPDAWPLSGRPLRLPLRATLPHQTQARVFRLKRLIKRLVK